jgi:hypothetical protein
MGSNALVGAGFGDKPSRICSLPLPKTSES